MLNFNFYGEDENQISEGHLQRWHRWRWTSLLWETRGNTWWRLMVHSVEDEHSNNRARQCREYTPVTSFTGHPQVYLTDCMETHRHDDGHERCLWNLSWLHINHLVGAEVVCLVYPSLVWTVLDHMTVFLWVEGEVELWRCLQRDWNSPSSSEELNVIILPYSALKCLLLKLLWGWL